VKLATASSAIAQPVQATRDEKMHVPFVYEAAACEEKMLVRIPVDAAAIA
jgi:hypothetical protein